LCCLSSAQRGGSLAYGGVRGRTYLVMLCVHCNESTNCQVVARSSSRHRRWCGPDGPKKRRVGDQKTLSSVALGRVGPQIPPERERCGVRVPLVFFFCPFLFFFCSGMVGNSIARGRRFRSQGRRYRGGTMARASHNSGGSAGGPDRVQATKCPVRPPLWMHQFQCLQAGSIARKSDCTPAPGAYVTAFRHHRD